ncbi:hypothetical protein TUM20984_29590 [Mycobacterium antarcticum]|nr:hypothetical protein TUM20984_29590 [Mycolicibacterium sp. TUM20984]
MQPSEREFHFRLDARRPSDETSGRLFDHVLQQRSLADSSLAAQDEHLARPGTGCLNEVFQSRAFVTSATQR